MGTTLWIERCVPSTVCERTLAREGGDSVGAPIRTPPGDSAVVGVAWRSVHHPWTACGRRGDDIASGVESSALDVHPRGRLRERLGTVHRPSTGAGRPSTGCRHPRTPA